MLPPPSAASGASGYAVRPATPADRDTLAAIHHRSWHASYATIVPASVTAAMTTDATDQLWRRWDAYDPTALVLLACTNDLAVGFVAVQIAAETADVAALFVDPMHQRVGHGSRLLNDVAARLTPRQVATLEAWVPAVDTAKLEFFRGAGLQPTRGKRTLATGEDSTADLVELHLSAALTVAPQQDPVGS